MIWHLPPPAPLDAAGMRFLATLAVAVILWSVNVFDDFQIALALLAAWIVAGIVRPEVALSGFTKPSWFLFVGALGIGAGVTRSGLLYRAALALVRRVRPSYASYTAILTLAGVLATPALPSMTGRMAVVAPVSWAIAESVGFAPRSPGAAGLVLATFLGFSLLGFAFLTGSTGGLLGWNALPEAARVEFGWTAWAVAAAPAGLVVIGGLWLAIHLLFRLPPGAGLRVSRERLQAQLDILGPFTRREAFSLGVLALALVGWSTTPLHGVGEAWVALGGLLLFFLGGVLDRGSFRANVDLGFLLFLGVGRLRGDQASLNVLDASFLTLGIEAITGGKPAFVNFTRDTLVNGYATILPKRLIVVEILEDVSRRRRGDRGLPGPEGGGPHHRARRLRGGRVVGAARRPRRHRQGRLRAEPAARPETARGAVPPSSRRCTGSR